MKTDDAFLFQAGEGAVEGPGRAEELAALVNSRLDYGTVYVIIEAEGTCKKGNFKFKLE